MRVWGKECVRRFSLKFQRIVEQEQDANFISRLHGGKLEIIPWPVIESKGFYKLFSTLKKLLDSQKSPHSTAGEFLHTIKTLMAKLKVYPFPACYLPLLFDTLWQANDWRALSRLYYIPVSLFVFILLDRDHDGTSYKNPLIPSPDRPSHRIY